MILDKITNAGQYEAIHPRLRAAFAFLRSDHLADLDPGRVEIDGDNLFAIVAHYQTMPVDLGKWEAHRRYMDVQYIVDGEERMGYANLEDMTVSEPYVEANDVAMYRGEGCLVTVRCGSFVVFGPKDVHMPNLAIDQPLAVKKVVAKVRV